MTSSWGLGLLEKARSEQEQPGGRTGDKGGAWPRKEGQLQPGEPGTGRAPGAGGGGWEGNERVHPASSPAAVPRLSGPGGQVMGLASPGQPVVCACGLGGEAPRVSGKCTRTPPRQLPICYEALVTILSLRGALLRIQVRTRQRKTISGANNAGTDEKMF